MKKKWQKYGKKSQKVRQIRESQHTMMAAKEEGKAVLTLKEAGIAPQQGIPGLAGYSLGFTPGATDALLVIDVQNGFTPGGALEVAEGDDVIPLLNALVEKFECVVMSQDWHPAGHASFASTHPGRQPYDEVQASYGAQTLWPDHCVQGTKGQGVVFWFFPRLVLLLLLLFFSLSPVSSPPRASNQERVLHPAIV